MLGLNRSNLAVVKLVEEICDKDGEWFVGDCMTSSSVCQGLEAAISTALFEAILGPTYIFDKQCFEILQVVGDELSLGYGFDDAKLLFEKKEKDYNHEGLIMKPTKEYFLKHHPKDSNVHFEEVLAKAGITQNNAGHWIVNGMAYCSYAYAQQAWLNSQNT